MSAPTPAPSPTNPLLRHFEGIDLEAARELLAQPPPTPPPPPLRQVPPPMPEEVLNVELTTFEQFLVDPVSLWPPVPTVIVLLLVLVAALLLRSLTVASIDKAD